MFDPDVIEFIVRVIDSVEQVEVLMIVRAQPGRSWTAAQVNEVVRSTESSIAAHLKKFADLGLLSAEAGGPPQFRYDPPAELSPTIDKLASAYRERRSAVIEYIYSKPIREMQSFSDAFKFRRKD